MHDRFGNVIAESDGTGPSGTTREYIWLPEAEIAPTFGSRTQVDRPLAVVDGVGTMSPQLFAVHVDHLHRPVMMTDGTKASVWSATWQPWGGVHAITGTATLNARFPGQWFQLEAGLHYNWHRHYDPSLGRYTQPDPLGFVDGPSVYEYAVSNPIAWVDPEGEQARGGRPPGRRLDPTGRYNPRALDYTPRPPQPMGGVYTLRSPDGAVCRVGRTKDLDRRERELLREFPDLRMTRDHPTNNYFQQRGYEQRLYDIYNPTLNLIRPISPTNPRREQYMKSIQTK